MRAKILLAVALVASASLSFAADAPAPQHFAVANIVLYQPSQELSQRLTVEKLATYIKSIESVLAGYFASQTEPETFSTVVAVRPGGREGFWFISGKRSGTDPKFDDLRKKLMAIQPPDVHGGPIAFTIVGRVAGGDAAHPPGVFDQRPVFPKEWQDAAKEQKTTLPFDDYMNEVWP